MLNININKDGVFFELNGEAKEVINISLYLEIMKLQKLQITIS